MAGKESKPAVSRTSVRGASVSPALGGKNDLGRKCKKVVSVMALIVAVEGLEGRREGEIDAPGEKTFEPRQKITKGQGRRE